MPHLSQSDTELEINRNAEIWTRKIEHTLASCRTRRTAREKYYLNQNETNHITKIHSTNKKLNHNSKEDLTIEIPSGTEYESSSGDSSDAYKESQHSSTNYSIEDGTGDRIYNEIELDPQQSMVQYHRVNPQHHHIYSIDELSGESDCTTNRRSECKQSYFVNTPKNSENLKPYTTKQSQFFYVSVKQSVPITRKNADKIEEHRKRSCNNRRRLTKSSERLALAQVYSRKEFHSSDDSTGDYRRHNNTNQKQNNSITKFEQINNNRALSSSRSSRKLSASSTDAITSNYNEDLSMNEKLNSKASMKENLIDQDLKKKKKRKFCQYFLCCCGS